MRFSLGVLACGFGLLSLVACGDDGEGSLLGGDRPGANGGTPNGGATSTKPVDDPPPPECAAEIPQPTLIASDALANSVHLTKHGVVYRAGPTMKVADRAGKGGGTLYTSPNIVSSWVDDASIVLVESVPDTDTSTLRVITMENVGTGGVAVPTAINPGSIEIFASDTTGFYMLSEAGGTEAIYRVEKANPGAMTLLTSTTTDKFTYPVLANKFVWYVKNGQRIYKVGAAQPIEGEPNEKGEIPFLPGAPPGAPEEVFGIAYSSVRLAVDEKNTFYSTGNLLEKRDLKGGNPAIVLDVEKSKSKAAFSTPLADSDSVIIPSLAADPHFKHIIRSVKLTAQGTEEKLVACGRETVPSSVVMDKTSVAWIEAGKGVFLAPR